MKKFFKFGCLGIIALIILGIIIAVATGGDDDTATPKTTTNKNETATKAPEETKESEKKGVLTKEKFDQIKDGMTYEEVVKIVGAEGNVVSESGEKGTDLYTVMYEFPASGSLGANASMMFQGGKLVNKAQFGLGGGGSDVTVTKAEFDKIQNGMTYEEVSKIIGGEGEVMSESGEKGTDLHTIMITYKGEGDLGANANFMFQGNKLQNKSQFGLK